MLGTPSWLIPRDVLPRESEICTMWPLLHIVLIETYVLLYVIAASICFTYSVEEMERDFCKFLFNYITAKIVQWTVVGLLLNILLYVQNVVWFWEEDLMTAPWYSIIKCLWIVILGSQVWTLKWFLSGHLKACLVKSIVIAGTRGIVQKIITTGI